MPFVLWNDAEVDGVYISLTHRTKNILQNGLPCSYKQVCSPKSNNFVQMFLLRCITRDIYTDDLLDIDKVI